MKVIIILLNWNRWKYTLECLESLESLNYPDFDVVVVDNGSEDGSQSQLEAARPDLTLLQTGVNLGYAGGNNAGIKYALEHGADYVWVLNNDTLVNSNTLSALVEAACSRSRVGIVGSVSMFCANGSVREATTSASQRRGERYVPVSCTKPAAHSIDQIQFVDVVAGASVLLDIRMLREIGVFDERFFHYFEDVELCERARKAGWAVAYACRSRVKHAFGTSLSTSSAQARYYYVRNWLLFSRWSRGLGLRDMLIRDPVLTVGRLTGVLRLKRLEWKIAAGGMLGALDAVRGRYGRRDVPAFLAEY